MEYTACFEYVVWKIIKIWWLHVVYCYSDLLLLWFFQCLVVSFTCKSCRIEDDVKN